VVFYLRYVMLLAFIGFIILLAALLRRDKV
jgi:hypothetical protein